MLNNILNMEGVIVLDKNQQWAIKGGNLPDTCLLRVETSNGVAIEEYNMYHSSQSPSEMANWTCVDLIENGGALACAYDCEWDGYTASWLQ